MINQNILDNEFYGLNPNRGYIFTETMIMNYGIIGKVLGFPLNVILSMLSLRFTDILSPQSKDLIIISMEEYHNSARNISVEKPWADTRLLSISQLRQLGKNEEFQDYLKQTAGHVRIEGIPSPHKIVAPKEGTFIAGGLFPRKVHTTLSFYAADSDGGRIYLGLESDLKDAWLHVLAAGDNNEPVEMGIQLNRGFDLTRSHYAVQHMSFPSEQVSFGRETFRVVERKALEEMVNLPRFSEWDITRQVDKDRIFRAMLELGYVY